MISASEPQMCRDGGTHLTSLSQPGRSASGRARRAPRRRRRGRGGCKAAAQELQVALAAAEARAGRLQRGQAEVRRRSEEAREAVLRSLRRVRELEALAWRVPGLQRGVRRLEAKLSCSAFSSLMLCLLSLGSCICEIMLNLAAWSPPSIHPPSVHAQSKPLCRSQLDVFAL
jgi:hypothetical protein